MRRFAPEAWLSVLATIALATLPIIVGILVVKIYRMFFPIVIEESVGISNILEKSEDGFFKKAIIGWIICGPIYYWVYESGIIY